MRVLASCYACEPGLGSEPGVGWNWVLQLARFHDVWVITRSNNREVIERQLEQQPLPSVRWIYLDLPYWMRFWKSGSRGLRPYYYLWQLAAYFRAVKLQREVKFEMVHHLTFVNYWMPSFLSLLPVPFVWGPVGGGESAPASFHQAFKWRARLYERARDLARSWGHIDPFVRMTARRARRTFCTTEQTLQRVKHLGGHDVYIYSEAGLPHSEISALMNSSQQPGVGFNVISIGRLLHWKGFELGLLAFAKLLKVAPEAEYTIIGEGPEASHLRGLTEKLGIAHRVQWMGKLPREKALSLLASSQVLLHPSLHDSGGWVCLESMACCVPVVCLNLGGPATQVTGETGIKVKAGTPNEAVEGIASALIALYSDPLLRERLGKNGEARVRDYFDWNAKGEWMRNVYKEIHATA